jgi:hypothetical protein
MQIVSTASSDTGCALKWRIARWLWMVSKSDMFACVMAELLPPTFSLTKHRHREKRIVLVTGFDTSDEKTFSRRTGYTLNNTFVVSSAHVVLNPFKHRIFHGGQQFLAWLISPARAAFQGLGIIKDS